MSASVLREVPPTNERVIKRLDAASTAAIQLAAQILGMAGRIRGERILIFGASALELLCAALRKGATKATLLREDVRPEESDADLAILIGVGNRDGSRAAIARACRALVPSGRIVLCIDADPTRRVTGAVARMLRMQGFHEIRARPFGDGVILSGFASTVQQIRHA